MMKRVSIGVLVMACAGLAVGLPALAQNQRAQGQPNAASERGGKDMKEEVLPIRRITLYRSGVGAFQRSGLVDGNATVQLRFDTSQINDILKSMVVLDKSKGQGRIEGVSYGSKEPLKKRLSSFAVDISDEPTVPQLLARLRGAEVVLRLSEGRDVQGVVLGVESRSETVAKDTVMQVTFVNLLTAEGMQSIRLSLVTSFDLKDEALRAELNKALAALAEYRADRTKTVDIRLTGQGAREIVVGYVQEAPVWKTSYRLILPDPSGAPQEKADVTAKSGLTLQGWAIVENTTDEDWDQVTLALVSGRPVSFKMDLYEPLYVSRPEVPVPTVPGVMPRAYEGGADLKLAMEPQVERGRRPGRAPGAPPAPTLGTAGSFDAGGAIAETARSWADAGSPLSSEDLATYAARTQAAAMEVGEVFQYELESPVTVERQRSAMLPILSAGIEGRRVSIYNPADGSTHPMRGVEIVNSSKLQLMPGPISVFDAGTYAGDAQVGHVPAGDKRLLAYAVDLDVDVTTNSNSEERTRSVKIVRGVVEFRGTQTMTQMYDFTNKDQKRARTLVVEHPRRDGWSLRNPEKPSEQTAQTYRFEVGLDAGKTTNFRIVEEIETFNSYSAMQMDVNVILQFAKTGAASDAVVNAFREIGRRQNEIAQYQRTMDELERERVRIREEQERIRANMNTIDRNSDLYRRYMGKFTEQETRIETIATETQQAQASRDRAQESLNDFIAKLSVE